MKTLIWKEFRQNRQTLVASLVLVSLPYVVVLLVVLYQTLRGLTTDVGRNLEFASGSSFWISVFLCAFLAANSVAGERVDRSSEFASYIPIPRTRALASKLLVALIGTLFLLVSNGMIFVLSVWLQNVDIRIIGSSSMLGLIAATSTFLFGVAWLLSNLLRSPSISAAGAIAGLVSFFIATKLFEEIYPDVVFDMVYFIACLSIGLMCLCGGAWTFLYRVEP